MNKLMNTLISRIGTHVSSLSLVAVYGIIYLSDSHPWVDQYLPANGKPFVLVLLVGIIIIYEVSSYRFSALETKMCRLSDQIAISNLKSDVNALYNSFIQSGDDYIDNEYTIRQLYELKDLVQEYGVNSYTQGRLTFLCAKIKRI